MKKILVPIDFSEQSKCALKHAASIAKKNQSEIYLLHMIDLPSGEIDIESHTDASSPAKLLFLEKTHEKMKEFMSFDFLQGIPVYEEVRFHKTFSGIINYSKELNCDLIVMGSQGASGLKEMFIGSNTEKVVRNSDIPVWVIKKGVEISLPEKFLFASDFSDEMKPAFGRFLNFISKFDNSRVDLVFINTIHNFETTQETSTRMRAFVMDFDMPDYTLNIYNDRSIEKGILNFANEMASDVITLVTHQRKGLESFFNESISEDLVNHALKPVLTFKV
jgi:nucleotide-binding universal stress UspA family protein